MTLFIQSVTMLPQGEFMEQNEMIQLKVWIPKTQHLEFKVRCALNQTSMTQVIGDLLTEYLKEKTKEVA